MGTAQDRPMRADARRNYERLLATARETVKAEGADASLEDIARRAGVGIGTLYRHFPDRFALMGAVFQAEVDALGEEARTLTSDTSLAPLDALTHWLRAYMAHAMGFRGIAAMLLHEGKLHNCHVQLIGYANALAGRAQSAGELRADVTPQDVLRLANALAYAAEKAAIKTPDDETVGDRLLALTLDGLRTRPSGPA
jgi:AcrR family transcriptional regulator